MTTLANYLNGVGKEKKRKGKERKEKKEKKKRKKPNLTFSFLPWSAGQKEMPFIHKQGTHREGQT